MTLIERILDKASKLGLRKKDIYGPSGIPQPTFSSWIMSNADSISSQYIPKIAEILGVSCDELLTGKPYSISLSGEHKWLLDEYDSLDWEGKQIVISTAIKEKRRMNKESDR